MQARKLGLQLGFLLNSALFSQCEDSFFFIGVYTPYTVPMELDGQAHSLVFEDSSDPVPIARTWCQEHLPNSHAHSVCTSHIVAEADKVKIEWRTKSMNHLLEQAEVLDRNAPMKLSRPLPGELYIGPAPFMVVTWDAFNGACSPSALSNANRNSKSTCESDMNTSTAVRSYLWRLLVLFRPTHDKRSSDQVVVDVAVDPGAGSWFGSLQAIHGATSDLASFGHVQTAIVSVDSLQQRILNDNESNDDSNYVDVRKAAVKSASCVSAAVPMGHSGTDKGTGRIAVSMERGDRGGAAAHASLKSWALAYQAGLTFAGSVRPMIAIPSPLLALLGLPSVSHLMLATGLPSHEINAVKDIYLPANAGTAEGWSVSLLSKSRVLAWMNNHSAAEAEMGPAVESYPLNSASTDVNGTVSVETATAASDGPRLPGQSGALDTWFTPDFRRLMHSHLRGAMAQPSHILAPSRRLVEEDGGVRGGCFSRRGTIERPWTVAVHVRRGDVRHDNDHHFRHLPNAHYLRTLRAIFHATAQLAKAIEHSNIVDSAAFSTPCSGAPYVSVHVFSESLSDESFAPFLDLDNISSACAAGTSVAVNVSIHLDSALEDAWAAFKDSDILIMSKSSFSYVPALYRHLRHTHTPENYSSRSGSCSGNTRSNSDIKNQQPQTFRSSTCDTSPGVEPQATLYTTFWHAPLGDWLVVPPLSEEASAEVLESRLQALSTAIADQLTGEPST